MSNEKKTATMEDIRENRLWAAVGYLGILAIVPLVIRQDSPFAQHHAKQGLVIFIAWILLWIGHIVPFIGTLIWFVGTIALLVLVVMGMKHALEGELWEAPYIGKYASQIKL